MSFFRSEKMSLWLMMFHVETAYRCAIELGYCGCVEFIPLDSDKDEEPSMMFVYDVQRCLAMQQTINFITAELEDAGIEIVFYPDVDENYKPTEEELNKIELMLDEYSAKLKNSLESYRELKQREIMLKEWHVVVIKAHQFLTNNIKSSKLLYSDVEMESLVHDDFHPSKNEHADSGKLHYLTGTIYVQSFRSFRMMIYRFFGHNVLIRNSIITEKYRNAKTQTKQKYFIILLNVGSFSSEKILKLCKAYHVTLYECPESPLARTQLADKIDRDITYIQTTLNEMDNRRHHILSQVASDIYIWKINVKKSLMAYVLLNKLGVEEISSRKKYLKADCWIPDRNVAAVSEALSRGCKKIVDNEELDIFPPVLQKRKMKSYLIPPTYFHVNKFTLGFQNLIDSYGIANYRELNPAPYTIITFPFLFALMYSDIGHGAIIALLAYYMIRNEKMFEYRKRAEKKENEIFNIVFSGRYILFLMGLFSIYAGFCYNDFMGKCLNIFGSSWHARYNEKTVSSLGHKYMLNVNLPKHFTGEPYWYGFDPMWHIAGEDSITTQNSLKMKISIVMGLSHMMCGLILSAINAFEEQKLADLFLVVIPSIIFMLCLFGYLVFLVFFKWIFFGGHHNSPHNTACAPSILITFIDMILFKESDKTTPGCEPTIYTGQMIVQKVLVVIAFLTVPIIFTGKPIYLMHKRRTLKQRPASVEETYDAITEFRSTLRYSLESREGGVSLKRKSSHGTLDEFNMSDVWIHSAIHCIETVLGSVSHTASYLRLWALSLAHFQLSEVLWNMILQKAFTCDIAIPLKAIAVSVAFVFWAILTLAILVSMESLSAFLHTLRLHWVEFQSKFYCGTGNRFEPFQFQQSTFKG